MISPWTVTRFTNDAEADNYRNQGLAPDIAYTKQIGVEYMPVIYPGFTVSNLMRVRKLFDKAVPNKIPRRCGEFYRHQVVNAVNAGAQMIYTAMFDEVDEGTAVFKIAPRAENTPQSPAFVSLDADGCPLKSDAYLRSAAEAASVLPQHGAVGAGVLK